MGKEIHVKAFTILTACAALLVVAPLAQGATRGGDQPGQATSPAIRAMTIRGEALNRLYHLGAYQGVTRPSASELRAMTIRGDALNRTYHLGNYATPAAPTQFFSDVANSNAVARFQAANRSDAISRYEANVAGDQSGTKASGSGDSVLQSPAIDAGIAAGLLLLLSLAGFTLVRSRNEPVRHA